MSSIVDYFKGFLQDYSAVATLISVLSIGVVYWYTNRSERIKTAKIVLSEIRYYEDLIRKIRDIEHAPSGLKEYYALSMLVSKQKNVWKECTHFFADILDADEFQLMNDFFQNCFIISEQINYSVSFFQRNLNEKSRMVEEYASKKFLDNSHYNHDFLMKFVESGDVNFNPHYSSFIIQRCLSKISMISTSSIGIKIKNISKGWTL